MKLAAAEMRHNKMYVFIHVTLQHVLKMKIHSREKRTLKKNVSSPCRHGSVKCINLALLVYLQQRFDSNLFFASEPFLGRFPERTTCV